MSDDPIIADHNVDVRQMQWHGERFTQAMSRITGRGATTNRLFDGSDLDGLPMEVAAVLLVERTRHLPWNTTALRGEL